MLAMCRFCERDSRCKKTTSDPLISPLSAWALKWYNEIEAGHASYPNAGTWQAQPPVFMKLMDIIRETLNRIEKEERMLREAKRAK